MLFMNNTVSASRESSLYQFGKLKSAILSYISEYFRAYDDNNTVLQQSDDVNSTQQSKKSL
jgi:hypothetical protein